MDKPRIHNSGNEFDLFFPVRYLPFWVSSCIHRYVL